MHNTEAQMLMKLQCYSITTDNISLAQDQSNMYLAWIFHMARLVTDHLCLVCHDRSTGHHFMLPLGDLKECLAKPYTEDFLCPTVCLLGAISVGFGPTISSSCEFHPVQTQGSGSMPVRTNGPRSSSLCLCSKHIVYPVGNCG